MPLRHRVPCSCAVYVPLDATPSSGVMQVALFRFLSMPLRHRVSCSMHFFRLLSMPRRHRVSCSMNFLGSSRCLSVIGCHAVYSFLGSSRCHAVIGCHAICTLYVPLDATPSSGVIQLALFRSLSMPLRHRVSSLQTDERRK